MSNQLPLVSIVTPLYNRQSLIKETIESVQNQTSPNWEHIIVDDGSKDNSQQVVKILADSDPRIKLFERTPEPKGAATCRNIGIQKASGEYVIFLDSDDVLSANCIEQRLRYAKNKVQADFHTFPMLLFFDDVAEADIMVNISTEDPPEERYIDGDNVWAITMLLWKRSSLLQLGGFNETLHGGQDIDLHLRALFQGLTYAEHINHAEPDCFYRIYYGERISKIKSLEKAKSHHHILNIIRANRGNHELGTRLTSRTLEVLKLYCEVSAYNEASKLVQASSLRRSDRIIFVLIILLYKSPLKKMKGFLRLIRTISNPYLKNQLTCSISYFEFKSGKKVV